MVEMDVQVGFPRSMQARVRAPHLDNDVGVIYISINNQYICPLERCSLVLSYSYSLFGIVLDILTKFYNSMAH